MTILKRLDVNKLTLGKNVKETPQGFLVIPAFTARTGIQSYRMADGSVLKEFRPEDEVFSESSMSSLRTAVVTDGHPKDMVSPENAHELMLGHTDGVIEKVQDGDEKFLKTHLVITHKKAIDAIRAGKAQLSNGYTVDLEFEPGEHNGQRYDAVQRNIINNHIAIVWKARAGEKASLRLDEKDAILLTNDELEKPKKELETMKLKIGDKEFEVADELGKAIKSEMAKMKSDLDEMSKHKNDSEEATKTIETLTTEKTELTAKVDSLESDIEKLKKEPKLDEEEVSKRVKETIAVRDNAEKILDKETIAKLDEMSNEEIKQAVVKADSPNVDEEKLKDSSYLNARYDHICENFASSQKKKDKLGKEIVEGRENNDSDDDGYKTPEQIRIENMNKQKQDSLGPVGVTE